MRTKAKVLAAGVRAVPSRAARRKGAQGILEKLLTLHGSRISVDRLSAEALMLILESFGVTRGALMIYDPRGQSLLLTAQTGLGTAGKERLRRVTRKDPRSWDMPLHGLLNERAYLIDAPADNRYVPPLLDEGNDALARVACIPIYRQRSPVGAFVLLAESGQRLTETEIRLAHVPLRYVGTIMDEAIQRHGLRALTDPDGGFERKTRPRIRPCVTDNQEVAAGADGKSSAGSDDSSAEILLTEIAEPGDSGHADGAYAALEETVAVLQDRDQAQRAEVQCLQGELAAAIAELEHRMVNCDSEHERQIASVAAERDALASNVKELTRAVAAKEAETEAHGEDKARLREVEAELDTVRQNAARTAASLEAALSELEARQQRISRLEEERTRLRTDSMSGRAALETEAGAEIARLREAETLARRMDNDLRVQNANLGRRVDALEQSLARSTAQVSAVRDREDTARHNSARWRHESERSKETVRQLEHDVESSAARVGKLEEEAAEARQERTEWLCQKDSLNEQIVALEQRIGASEARASELAATELAARNDGEESRRRLEHRESQIATLEHALESATAEAAALEAREVAARRESETWRTEASRRAETITTLERKINDAACELTQRVAAMEDRLRRQDVARTAVEQRARRLEGDLAKRDEDGRDSESTRKRLASEHRAAHAEAARVRLQAEASESKISELENERGKQARHVASLEAAIARLETERAIRMQSRNAPIETPKARVSAAGTAGAGAKETGVPNAHGAHTAKTVGVNGAREQDSKCVAEQRFVIVEPTAAAGRTLTQALGARAQWIQPVGDTAAVVEAVCRAKPTIIGINLGTRGPVNGFAIVQALTRAGIAGKARLWAYVAPEQATKAIALGPIECLPPPVESVRLVELLRPFGEKGARALTVGLEMNGLIALRERLTQMGVSLSMAWDSKQGQELLEMVHPHVVVVNLDLGRGDGYRTLGRLAGMKPRHSWILCGGATPPAEAGSLVVTGATQSASGAFLALSDIAAALLTDLDGTGRISATKTSAPQRPQDRGAGGSTRGTRTAASSSRRTIRSSGRRDVAAGTHRR